MLGAVKNKLLLLEDRQVWLRRSVELALAVSAGFIALGLISLIRQNHPAPPSYMESAAPSAYRDVARRAGEIAQHHLFGESAESVKIAQTADDTLSLTGIIYSTNPDDSRAMLQAGDTTLVVASGTQLPDGGKVTSIGVDRIDIDRDGTTEELVLKIEAADIGGGAALMALNDGDGGGDMSGDPQAQADSARHAVSSSAPMTQIYHAAAVPLSAIRGKEAAERFKLLRPPVLPARKAKKP
jgi:hypothetical protein